MRALAPDHMRVLAPAQVFISHILAAAGAPHCFKEVLTNPASFVEALELAEEGSQDSAALGSRSSDSSSGSNSSGRSSMDSDESASKASSPASSSGSSGPKAGWLLKGLSKLIPGKQRPPPSPSIHRPRGPPPRAAQKLVIRPHHVHSCPHCPSNMCKGAEIKALKQAGAGPIIYAGDGVNDICACTALGAGDIVLARRGYPLAEWAVGRGKYAQGLRSNKAAVQLWSSHEELERMVQLLV